MRKLFCRADCCQGMTRSRVAGMVILTCGLFLIVYTMYSPKPTIYNIDVELVESEKSKVVQSLNVIAEKLTITSRSVSDGRAQQLLIDTYGDIHTILTKLGHKVAHTNDVKEKTTQNNPDICQDKYAFEHLNGDYPYFYKGFEIEKCSGVPDFHTILTLVYNFVHYTEDDLTLVSTLLTNVNKVYPQIKIIAAVPSSLRMSEQDFNDTKIIPQDTSITDAKIWNDLISQVTTKYVYLGRNAIHFTWFDRLERLVREINNLDVYAVGAAIRGFKSGHWTNGCQQSILRNYTLVYTHGYDRSLEECQFCHDMEGPFVAKTDLFKKLPLHTDMAVVSSFAMWFLAIKTSGKLAVVCPDSMSFVTDKSREPTNKQDWAGLALNLQVEKIRPQSDLVFEYSCTEAQTQCSGSKGKAGIALSHCCLRELSTFVKLVMRKCKDFGMLCELQEGSLLGALKFNGLLPWELDADLALHSNNYTSFAEKVIPYFKSLGYTSSSSPGVHQIFSESWKVELFAQARMDSQLLINQGLSPTTVNMDGEDLRASESPGLMARNRYGHEIYKHAQHWSQTGSDSSWNFYEAGSFAKCPTPGVHYCLDQFIADGSLIFTEPSP